MFFKNKKSSPPVQIPPNAFEEIEKCIKDPKYFISNYIKIQTDEDGGAISYFKLFDYQEDVIDSYINNRFNIILKSRQLGLSTLSAAYSVWRLIFFENETVLCIANIQDTATLLIDKTKFMIKGLPDWMKQLLNVDKFEVNNRESIHFLNGNKIFAAASTINAGVGNTLSFIILDEAALIDNAEELWRTLYPMVEKRGRGAIISTPRGEGNFFHKTYVDADSQLNSFTAIELGWHVRKGRDKAWAIKTIKENGPSLFASEYACQFLGSGTTLINAKILKNIEQNCIEPEFKGKEIQKGLWIWKKPIDSHKYICSIDIASGESDVSMGENVEAHSTDYSAMVMIDIDTNEIVAEYYGKIRPLPFGRILYEICIEYNKCLFVYEANAGWALPIYDYFALKNYRAIYHHPKDLEKGAVDFKNPLNKPGFPTTESSRQKIIEILREDIETYQIKIYSHRLVNELKTFCFIIKRGRTKGRYEAKYGFHDDLCMCLAIALYVKNQFFYFKNKGDLIPILTRDSSIRRQLDRRQFTENPFQFIWNKQKDALKKEENSEISSQTYGSNIMKFSTETLGGTNTEEVDLQEFTQPSEPIQKSNYLQKSIFDNFIDQDVIDENAQDNTWKIIG